MASEDLVARAIRGAGVLLAIASAAWAAYILGAQCYHYLRAGEWAPIGALTYWGALFGWDWAVYPADWHGLHGMLNYINAGVAAFFCGVFAAALMFNFERR